MLQNDVIGAKKGLRRIVNDNLLIVVTVLALVIANLPGISEYYFSFWQQEFVLRVGEFNLFSHGGHVMTVQQVINDALMAVFFFAIGLEIKREVLAGELSSFKKALLPILAACGGMVVPVALFGVLSLGKLFVTGAAIPMATDIAFSLGVLAMFGSRVPLSLKIFLTTLAVVDDIGGILVIATCYSTGIEWSYMLCAAVVIVLLAVGSAKKLRNGMFYLILGIIVWYLFLNAGIHPTIAGVIVAFCISAKPVGSISQISASANRKPEDSHELSIKDKRFRILTEKEMAYVKNVKSAATRSVSMMQSLEDRLHPVVNRVIVPIFAFANAGVYLGNVTVQDLFSGVSLAIIAGLFVGKFVGILLSSWLAVKFRLAPMPHGADWKMVGGVAMLGGIGFTVSLFIANLSFTSPDCQSFLDASKLGILVGSLLSGICGYVMLRFVLPQPVAADSTMK